MQNLKILILSWQALLLISAVNGAKKEIDKSPGSGDQSLNDKVQQWLDLSQRRTVVKLSNKLFKLLKVLIGDDLNRSLCLSVGWCDFTYFLATAIILY